MRISDWSSDVCSSDLRQPHAPATYRVRDDQFNQGSFVVCTRSDAVDRTFDAVGIQRRLKMLESAEHIPIEFRTNEDEPSSMEDRGCVRFDRCGATVRLAFEGNELEVRTLDVAFGDDRSWHTQRRQIGAIEQWRPDIGGIEDGETVYGMPVACGAQKGGGGLAIM